MCLCFGQCLEESDLLPGCEISEEDLGLFQVSQEPYLWPPITVDARNLRLMDAPLPSFILKLQRVFPDSSPPIPELSLSQRKWEVLKELYEVGGRFSKVRQTKVQSIYWEDGGNQKRFRKGLIEEGHCADSHGRQRTWSRWVVGEDVPAEGAACRKAREHESSFSTGKIHLTSMYPHSQSHVPVGILQTLLFCSIENGLVDIRLDAGRPMQQAPQQPKPDMVVTFIREVME